MTGDDVVSSMSELARIAQAAGMDAKRFNLAVLAEAGLLLKSSSGHEQRRRSRAEFDAAAVLMGGIVGTAMTLLDEAQVRERILKLVRGPEGDGGHAGEDGGQGPRREHPPQAGREGPATSPRCWLQLRELLTRWRTHEPAGSKAIEEVSEILGEHKPRETERS